MRYFIERFYQPYAIKIGLKLEDLIVLAWFIDFKNTDRMKTKIIKDEVVYYISYNKVLEDLPILRIKSKKTIQNIFNRLIKAKVLKKIIEDGNTVYMGIGENYINLLKTNETESQLTYPVENFFQGDGKNIPGGLENFFQGGWKNFSTYSNIINSNATNSNTSIKILPKEELSLQKQLYYIRNFFLLPKNKKRFLKDRTSILTSKSKKNSEDTTVLPAKTKKRGTSAAPKKTSAKIKNAKKIFMELKKIVNEEIAKAVLGYMKIKKIQEIDINTLKQKIVFLSDDKKKNIAYILGIIRNMIKEKEEENIIMVKENKDDKVVDDLISSFIVKI